MFKLIAKEKRLSLYQRYTDLHADDDNVFQNSRFDYCSKDAEDAVQETKIVDDGMT